MPGMVQFKMHRFPTGDGGSRRRPANVDDFAHPHTRFGIAPIRPTAGRRLRRKVAGRIFVLDAVAPEGRPWMWASGHNGEIKRASLRCALDLPSRKNP